MSGGEMSGPSLGVLMFVAHRALEARITAAVRAAGYADVTLAQSRVFARIGERGTRASDLAEMAQVTKQTASFLLDRLEDGGYVERVPDPTDGRARLVRISAKGRLVQAVAVQEEQAIYREWLEHLGADDFARLSSIMSQLREVTDPYRHLDPES